jgi:hypothetical protein
MLRPYTCLCQYCMWLSYLPYPPIRKPYTSKPNWCSIPTDLEVASRQIRGPDNLEPTYMYIRLCTYRVWISTPHEARYIIELGYLPETIMRAVRDSSVMFYKGTHLRLTEQLTPAIVLPTRIWGCILVPSFAWASSAPLVRTVRACKTATYICNDRWHSFGSPANMSQMSSVDSSSTTGGRKTSNTSGTDFPCNNLKSLRCLKCSDWRLRRPPSPLTGNGESDFHLTLKPNEDPTTLTFRCGPNATTSGNQTKTMDVNAGDTVGFGVGEPHFGYGVCFSLSRCWESSLALYFAGSWQCLHEQNFKYDVPRLYHPGPASAWLSKAPSDDLDAYTGDGDWFKILNVITRTNQSIPITSAVFYPFQAQWGTYLATSVSASPHSNPISFDTTHVYPVWV